MRAIGDTPRRASAAFSRPFADRARRLFRLVKARELERVGREQCTQAQAIATMHRAYVKLLKEYLRISGTTYGTWLTEGPTLEWDEVTRAVADAAIWDRLVERGIVEEHDG